MTRDRRPHGDHLFTFVVVADTHMNQSEERSSSPYLCNTLANARTRRVVAEINRIAPELVIHLGDIVNPVPELPTYVDAAEHFKAQVAELEAPLHLVPGNHDIGDKPVSWSPAGTVNEDHLRLYESHFGAHYFAFEHRDCRFIVVNSPIINSGLPSEAAQRGWLENELAAHAGKRTFVCIHYPPYVSDPAERGHYDNIDEPGRGWLLDLLSRHRPEAMFCGHVHNFWYDLYDDTEIYILPSTAFVRHDYSELFRIAPVDEHGRDDGAKLGYMIVHVHERGHVAETVRTFGRTLAPREAPPPPHPVLAPAHTKRSTLTWLGVDMRHPWAEEVAIPPSGALDEFERKLARNDYPVLAFLETGLARMRVPAQDLVDPRVRRRMTLMHALGVRFQLCCYGLPGEPLREALAEHSELVEALEVVIEWDRAGEHAAALRALGHDLGPALYLSRVNRKDAARYDGARFNHLISHGFTLAERTELEALQAAHDGCFRGFLFRVAREDTPSQAVAEAQAAARSLDARACLYLKSSTASPAETFDDDRANAARIAEAVVAAAGAPEVELVLDTFADADRGYFARTGLVDRRYNPRLAARVLAGLVALLGDEDWAPAGDAVADGDARVVRVRDEHGAILALVCPGADGCRAGALAALATEPARAAPEQWVDLDEGRVHAIDADAGPVMTTPFAVLAGRRAPARDHGVA